MRRTDRACAPPARCRRPGQPGWRVAAAHSCGYTSGLCGGGRLQAVPAAAGPSRATYAAGGTPGAPAWERTGGGGRAGAPRGIRRRPTPAAGRGHWCAQFLHTYLPPPPPPLLLLHSLCMPVVLLHWPAMGADSTLRLAVAQTTAWPSSLLSHYWAVCTTRTPLMTPGKQRPPPLPTPRGSGGNWPQRTAAAARCWR